MGNKLSEKLISKLGAYTQRNYTPSQPILYQGEIPQVAYIIMDGVIKIYDIDSNGNEKIVSFASTGDVLSPAWTFNKAPVNLYYCDAFTEAKLCCIAKEELHNLIKSSSDLLSYLFDQQLTAYIGAQIQINALEQSKANEKIIYTLQYLVLRFSKQTNQAWVEISLRLTHQDIANMNGLTRETTTTELNKLRKKGVIRYKGQVCHVNVTALRRLLSSDEFVTIKR